MQSSDQRSQRGEREIWRLEDIFASDAAWEAEFDKAAQAVGKLSEFQGKLADRDTLLTFLKLQSAIHLSLERLYVYAHMRRDEDNGRSLYQGMTDRAQTLSARTGALTAYAEPEILALEERYLDCVSEDAAFSDYDVYLRDLKRKKPHTLSASEEKLLAMASEVTQTPSTAYDMLTDADMVFPEIEGEDGKKFRLTQSNYIPTMMSRDRTVRKNAFTAFYQTFAGFGATIPALYAGSVKGDWFFAEASKFDSSLSAALFPDNVPREVYLNLIEETHAHIESLNRYLKINGRLLGIEDMQMYDVYVPAAQGFRLELPFEEAYREVEKSLSVLGEDYLATLRRAREDSWIDPFENAGKSSGAYSWGTYDTHPYVLLNYHENIDGLSTIAHEMGHAMHSHYSNSAQPFPKAGYSLFVAEVASTVNEVLTVFSLMDRYPSRECQAYLINHLLDSYRTTLFRQTMFAEFELRSHEMAEKGEALTCESLNALYAELNARYYPAIGQNPEIRLEWMRIPHFYRAFYVYQYATGFSAAVAIARMLREEGEPAVKRYKAFLSTGGSLDPIDELRVAGVDMASREPVKKALELFDELVARYEKTVFPEA